MKLYCDNKSTINIAHNPVQHDRTKHVEVDNHFIEEILEGGLVYMPVPKEKQLADILTRSLQKQLFEVLVKKLGMLNILKLTWGGMWKIIKYVGDLI